MNKKLVAIALTLVVVSVVFGYVVAYVVSTQPIFVPANHTLVAQQVWIKDDATGENLTLHYMGGVFSISMPSLNQFPPGHTYAYSRWEWDAASGVEAFMVVAGPGLDGKTYGIEISRKSWDELTVTVPGGQTFDFPTVTSVATVSPGYVSFEFVPLG